MSFRLKKKFIVCIYKIQNLIKKGVLLVLLINLTQSTAIYEESQLAESNWPVSGGLDY